MPKIERPISRHKMIVRPTTLTEALRYINTTTIMLNQIQKLALCVQPSFATDGCKYCFTVENARYCIVTYRKGNETYYHHGGACGVCYGILSAHYFRGACAEDTCSSLKRNTVLCAMGLGPHEMISAYVNKNCAWCGLLTTTRMQFEVSGCASVIHQACIQAAEKEANIRSLAYHVDRLWQWAAWLRDLLVKDVIGVISALHVSLHNKYWIAVGPIQI